MNKNSSLRLAPETADLEFAMTAEMGKNNVMEKGDNLAWHMIISYHPNDLTDPKLAHEVSTKIADSVLKGKYEYVLTTHTDKKHIHSHLLFNATSFTDYHKYVSNKRTYHKICQISNRICKEHGLSTSMPTSEAGRSYKEDMEYILQSKSFDWNRIKNSTILVTGGTGLIGSTLINSLVYADIKKNYDIKILALVRNVKKAEKIFSEQLKAEQNLEFVQGSIEEIPEIKENIDYIIHCASPTASSFFIEYPVETIKTAVQGTINVLELAKEKKIKGMVYLSSMELYGKIEKDEFVSESELGYIDPLNIRSCYPESKRMCENLCACYAAEYEVPVYQVRLAQTFGPGISYEDKRVFAMMARKAIEGKDIILQTKGTSKHPYVYTAQAVTAIFTVLLGGKSGEAYNVSNPETYCSIYEMGKLVSEKVANGKIKVIVAKNGDISKYPVPSCLKLDISKIENLGWKPEHNLLWMYNRLIKTM